MMIIKYKFYKEIADIILLEKDLNVLETAVKNVKNYQKICKLKVENEYEKISKELFAEIMGMIAYATNNI